MAKIKPNQAVALQYYEDLELIKLRRELKTLTQTLVGLQAIKGEIEEQITTLSRRYQQELGHLLSELLELRRGSLEQDPEDFPENEAEAGPQAGADYESSDWKVKHSRREPLLKLSPEQQRELKSVYRKASKLCHPDVINGKSALKARATFIELKLAYERNDLERVKEIYHILQQDKFLDGDFPASNDKAILQAEIKYLRARAKTIYQEIQHLKQSQTYKRLEKVDDWDAYFDKIKTKLQRQIDRLRRKTPSTEPSSAKETSMESEQESEQGPEHEFLRQRLQLVEEQLDRPDQEFDYAGQNKVHRYTPDPNDRATGIYREARLLRKLLAQTREGQVLAALQSWRRKLGQFLSEHRRTYQKMEQAYDRWQQLPLYQRDNVPQPPQPPPARFIDQAGESWIIDDRFLALLDDLAERLQKWLNLSS